jgi:hypothetical protein
LVAPDRGIDAGNQRLRAGALNIDDHPAVFAEPQVWRPPVQAHRIAPAGDVVAPPVALVLALDHDPAMDREDALPAAGAAGHDHDPRLRMLDCRRQVADHAAVPVAPVRRAAAKGQRAGAGKDGQQKYDEKG